MSDWRNGPLSPDQVVIVGATVVAINLEQSGRPATPAEAALLREAAALIEADILDRQRQRNLATLLDELGALTGAAAPSPSRTGEVEPVTGPGGSGAQSIAARPDQRSEP